MDNNDLYKILFDQSCVGMAVIDAHGGLQEANRGFLALFDVARREDVPAPWLTPDSLARLEKIARVPSQSQTAILSLQCAKGRLLHITASVSSLSGADAGGGFLVQVLKTDTHLQAGESVTWWHDVFDQLEWGIVAGLPDGSTMVNMNTAFASMYGYRIDELLHRPIVDVFSPECREALAGHIALAHEKGHHCFESWHVRKDGSRFPVYVDISTLKNPDGVPLCRLVNVQDISERKQAEHLLLESRALLRSMAAHREMELEGERKKIAHEVHDELGQLLSTLRLKVMMLKKQTQSSQPEIAAKMLEMLGVIDQTLATVRRVATTLRPAVLDLGIVAGLEWLLQDFGSHTGIACELRVEREPEFLNEETSVCLFRIAQESLTNVLRHSNASKVTIRVAVDEKFLHLEIADDGNGLDSEKMHATSQSFGLAGMRERAENLGGELSIESEPGNGCAVRVMVPLSNEEYTLI